MVERPEMEITHDWESGPEILTATIGDADSLYRELKLLEPILREPKDTGTAKNADGSHRKENRGVFFGDVYTPLYAECSPVSKVFERFIDDSKALKFTPNSAFQSLYCAEGFNVLFSAYRNGDYYKPHRDKAKLTALMWVGENNFSGGDLVLPDFGFTIPYEPNKLIMFPSHYLHEVTEVTADTDGFVRYCASAFIN